MVRLLLAALGRPPERHDLLIARRGSSAQPLPNPIRLRNV